MILHFSNFVEAFGTGEPCRWAAQIHVSCPEKIGKDFY